MARAESAAVQELSALLASGSLTGVSDRLLLERFVSQPGAVAEAAFAALVARHGPMVLKVCRAMTTDHADAQDAFQVTFLVLATKAGRLRDRRLLANWLYGVATRSALKLRAKSARRRRHEGRAARRPDEAASPAEVDAEDHAVLYEEIDALPERYRAPVVLCHLEGMTREMAASELGCPVSTLNVRLMRARDRLKKRLTGRQGHPAAAPMLLENPTTAVLPAPLVRLATDAASLVASGKTATIPHSLLTLAQEVRMAMSMTKLKVVAGLLLAFGVTTAGVATVAAGRQAGDAQGDPAPKAPDRPGRGNPLDRHVPQAPRSKGTRVTKTRAAKAFASAAGWSWMMSPSELEIGKLWGQTGLGSILTGYSHIDANDGSLRLFLVQSGATARLSVPEYRLVVLDAAGNRYLPERDRRSSGGGFKTSSDAGDTHTGHALFTLAKDTLDPKKATYLGIEKVVRFLR